MIFVGEVRDNKIMSVLTFSDTQEGEHAARNYFDQLCGINKVDKNDIIDESDLDKHSRYVEQGDWTIQMGWCR